MAPSRNRIAELLLKAHVIDELQLRSALARHDQWGGRLSRLVADMRLAPEEALTEAISQGTGVPRIHLGPLARDAGALARLDASFCEQHGLFPVALRDNGKSLVLAIADPTDLTLMDQVAARARARIIPMVAGDREIEHAILRHYRNQEPTVNLPAHPPPGPEGSASGEKALPAADQSGPPVRSPTHPSAAEPSLPAAPSLPEPPRHGPSAAELLEELLHGGAPVHELTEEEQQRLRTVQANQEKSSRVLHAVLELLLEKGALEHGALMERVRS